MNITVVRSGGFAGTMQAAALTTDLLSDGDRQRVEQMASALPDAEIAQMPAPPDAFQYDVTITDGKGTRSARYFGESNPASTLVDEVFEHGSPVEP